MKRMTDKKEDMTRRKLLAKIASKFLDTDTLDTQLDYTEDFFEISIWDLRAVLEEAYDAGKNSNKKPKK
jgi:hypothetical protein